MSHWTCRRRTILFAFALVAAVTSAPFLRAQDGPIITVLDFETNNVAEGEMKMIISLITSHLFRTDRYVVIDVAQRDTILKEIAFSLSDCADDSCQVEVGRLLAAELILVGTIGRTDDNYVVSARILDVSTSKTVGTADGVFPTLDALIEGLESLVMDLAGMATDSGAESDGANLRGIGLFADARLLGATMWAAGAGPTFLDDLVKLQLFIGKSPGGRFPGFVVGARLLANVLTLEYGSVFGPGWDFLSSGIALGADFSYFTMIEDRIAFTGDGAILAAIVGQIEIVRLEARSWRFLNALSLYTEAQLWVFSSDVEGGTIFKLSFGLSTKLF